MAKIAEKKEALAQTILQHPDKDELVNKMIMQTPIDDIVEWLAAKYEDVAEKKFVLSKKALTIFRDEYLDFYAIVRDDVHKTLMNNNAPSDELKKVVQGSGEYHNALKSYADQEVDIKSMLRKMVLNVENRIATIYEMVSEDPQNMKMDRTLIEYFNTLLSMVEKFDPILNGETAGIGVQNNINIQVLDSHMNVIYNIIKEILTKLDYDTSLMFIEMFNEEMSKIKGTEIKAVAPIEQRLADVKILSQTIESKQ